MRRLCQWLACALVLTGGVVGCNRHQDDIPVHQPGDNPFAAPEGSGAASDAGLPSKESDTGK